MPGFLFITTLHNIVLIQRYVLWPVFQASNTDHSLCISSLSFQCERSDSSLMTRPTSF